MILEANGLKKSFDGNEVLHGVSFSISSGKALGLLGRNGAGKTTTIRILMDVFKANEGSITIDGKPFKASDYKIGYLPEERGLYPKKRVDEQLLYLAALRGLSKNEAKANLKKWLKRLNIEEYEKRKLDTLSKGNQQKVQLAQTLMCDPPCKFTGIKRSRYGTNTKWQVGDFLISSNELCRRVLRKYRNFTSW